MHCFGKQNRLVAKSVFSSQGFNGEFSLVRLYHRACDEANVRDWNTRMKFDVSGECNILDSVVGETSDVHINI